MNLKTFFKNNPALALGFSGGVDSSYLLYAGQKYGAKIKAYFIKTAFQPEFELKDAYRIAGQLGTEITVLHNDVLSDPVVASNPVRRCYHCKLRLFSLIKEQALKDGFPVIIDGTNASDNALDRPGMQALSELGVLSPLKECGITKDEVRRLSKEVGLFTWDKPAYACLATRIPVDMPITAELLFKVERSEEALFSLGFTDFRVRVYGEGARLQLRPDQMAGALSQREAIIAAIKPYFPVILMDLAGR